MNSRVCAALVFLFLAFFALSAKADHAININTADKETLMTLNGIGEVKAQAIIDYRESSPFATIEDIQNVSGIGDATYNNIKDHITVSGGTSSSPPPSPTPSSASPSPSPSPSSSSASGSKVAPPDPELYVDAGNDQVVIAGADIEFRARAYNRSKEIVENVRFLWNFGDGITGKGAVVKHTFMHPGRYAIVASLSGEESKASDRLTVAVEEGNIQLEILSDGGVAIKNGGKNDVDLSRWIIHSGGAQFMLPEDSLVLSGQTMSISRATLGFAAGLDAELQYPSGASAYRVGEEAGDAAITATPPNTVAASLSERDEKKGTQEVEEPDFADVGEAIVKDDEAGSPRPTTSAQMAAAARSSAWKWWGGALILSLLGAGSMYAAKRYSKREWSIIEDTSE